jgi:hypothetical protein
MERHQFKGPRRSQRPRYNPDPVTPLPPLFGMGKRDTNPLKMQDEYQRANASIWETGQHTVPGGFPPKTYYDIKPGESINSALFNAATEHVFARIDRKVPRKMKLGKKTYQNFRHWMISCGYDPNEGYTYARQGDENTAHTLIEPEPTLADTVIICYH